jgi:hypothetical protein
VQFTNLFLSNILAFNKTNIKSLLLVASSLFFLFTMFSCSPTYRLADDEELYNRSKIVVDNRRFDKTLLKRYQRISENKRILGVRFHLFIHNLANPDKDTVFPHEWFRKIGESPVIYDSLLVAQNVRNFEKYLNDIGYNNAIVSDSISKPGQKKKNVEYLITLNEPTLINKFDYFFEDTSIQRYIYQDTLSALISSNDNLDKTLLQKERLRIETLLRNNGYYKFSKEYIFYEIEKVKLKDNAVNVTMHIKQNVSGYIDPVLKVRPHIKYYINEVFINPYVGRDSLLKNADTIDYKGFRVLASKKVLLQPSTLITASRIEPGYEYSLRNVNKTYSNLSSMGLFRFMNISFSEAEPSEGHGNLNADIELSLRKRQSYQVELTATNSAGDFGGRGSIVYNNFNLFKGGEHFQFGVSGAYESLKQRLDLDEPKKEYGISSRFETPKFLLPFYPLEFQRKFSPRTAFELSYNTQVQPYYTRTIANTSISYIWRGNSFNRHAIYPIDFYLVKLPVKDEEYIQENISQSIRYSFENHAILAFRYAFQFSTQSKGYNKDFRFFQTNIESAGPILNLVNKKSKWGEDSLFFGVNYAQYLRCDLDVRQFKVIDPINRVVYRLYAGIGIPYGNSDGMPFEKMYWSGGPYGIRAWEEHGLGPGSYPDSTKNQLGDIKLEANLEYRFKMFWKLEGALFADVGNVWLLKEDPQFPGAAFKLNSFYNDLAVGVGFGFRFDFSFIIIRTDFGFKMRDPAIQPKDGTTYPENVKTGNKWTVINPNVNFWEGTFQFGIGYPF